MCPPFALMTASTQSGILHTSDTGNSSPRASQEAIEASAGLYEAAEALLLGLLCWMRRVGLLILRCRVPGVTSFINWGCISYLDINCSHGAVYCSIRKKPVCTFFTVRRCVHLKYIETRALLLPRPWALRKVEGISSTFDWGQ